MRTMQFFFVAAIAMFATSGSAVVLRGSQEALSSQALLRAINATAEKNITAKDVTRLRDSMSTMLTKLEHLMELEHSKDFNKTVVGADMESFISQMKSTLEETKSEKNATEAMSKLRSVQGGFRKLAASLTKREQSLHTDGEMEVDAVLLGVLMAERNETMTTQLDILKTPTFAVLDSAKTLQKKHNDSQPLFQQLAAYMDKRSGQKTGTALQGKRSQAIAKALAYFEKRTRAMEKEEAKSKEAHDKRAKEIDALLKKASKKEAHSMQSLKKRSERLFKKNAAMHHHQLKLMEDVVSALKSGNMGEVDKAQAALKDSLNRLKAKTADFLYLLQTQ